MGWSDGSRTTKLDDHARFSIGRYGSHGGTRLRVVISHSLGELIGASDGLRYSLQFGRGPDVGWMKIYRDARKGNTMRRVTVTSSDHVFHFNLDDGVKQGQCRPPEIVREWGYDDDTRELLLRLPDWAVPPHLWEGYTTVGTVVDGLRIAALKHDEDRVLLTKAANVLSRVGCKDQPVGELDLCNFLPVIEASTAS